MAYNILIVDDSKTARAFIAKSLEVAGIEIGAVFEAENGKQALDVLHSHWIDIVLADINMPEMSGLEMVQQMKQDGLMQTVPVVIISTERSLTRIAELKAAGVRDYMNKPFTPENIKQAVDRILGGRGE
ncbi:MAG TPA: response regulator [Verrucomicrobia bacterium]|nr:MAG: two-component system response regulator [Lentisphaerae bacterium GWF2_57_35]HBA84076.1 response regulator [Verrucomicrobiota bacterium]